MSVADAFISLVNLINKSFLKSFYGDNPDEVCHLDPSHLITDEAIL